jgi:4-hydroxybenzoate polyprenyltransferase
MESKSFFNSAVLLIKSRKEALGLWLWCAMVAALMAGRGFPPMKPSLISFVSTFLIATSVYVYNDVVDMDADRQNTYKDERPLASGKVPKSHAMRLIYISSSLGLIVSFLNGLKSFLFSALYFVVFSLYSYPMVHLKKRFLVKEIVISSGLLIIGMSVNYAILGSFSARVLFGFLMFSVFAFFAMPTGFDSTDVAADKIQGVRTIASIVPFRRRVQLAVGGMLIVMAVTPFTFAIFGYNVLLPISVAVTGLIFFWLMLPLMMSVDPNSHGVNESVLFKTRKIIVIFIFIICGCVILGSLNLSVFTG